MAQTSMPSTGYGNQGSGGFKDGQRQQFADDGVRGAPIEGDGVKVFLWAHYISEIGFTPIMQGMRILYSSKILPRSAFALNGIAICGHRSMWT